jgi:hypothetical protein
MEEQVDQMGTPRPQPEHFDIQHVGNPCQRMPVAHVHRREGPRKPLFRQTRFYARVIEDVPGIIEGSEGMAPDLSEDQENHDGQGDTPKRLRGYGTNITHGYAVPGFPFLKDGIFPDSLFLHPIFMTVDRTPNPYQTLLEKLTPDADQLFYRSVKALAGFGTVTFLRIPLRKVCGEVTDVVLADHASNAIIYIENPTDNGRVL